LLKLIVAFSTLEFNFPALFVLRIGWQRNEGQQEPRVTLPQSFKQVVYVKT